MRWEELTGDLFPQAVKQTKGVCLLPLSCIERHGHHLPLGTDMFIGRELCNRAAEIEPAVVFPDFYFTQILEARHVPGTIGIEPELIIRLMENACREIARNGLKKIVIVNAHGGNDNLIHYFSQIQLASPRDYVVYVAQPSYNAEESATAVQWETTVDGHAGERETSMIMAVRPELVNAKAMPANGEGMPQERLKALRDQGTDMGIWWYADHPTHYCGDGRPATAKKGEVWFADRSKALAKVIRTIKDDKKTKQLQDEFFKKTLQH
ncbi:MAG TPA: creatininase family protein [Anaerolineales bacterium]|nr:creatininase family protein [Anaerolineales bacterium]